MLLFDSSFSNYNGNMYDISLEENEEVSFINEQEHPQSQFSQDQDLYSPRISNQLNELYPNEEEEPNYPSLENITQSFMEIQNLISDEKPPSPMIQPTLEQNLEPKNKQVFDQANIIQKETTNTSLTKTTKGNTLLGRKRREDKGKGVHSKYKPDNKMRKVKSYQMKYIHNNLNSSLSPNQRKFLKITPKVNEDLNRNYNMSLMKKTIKEIYEENSINGRYSKEGIDKDYNKDIIEEIYQKNEETEAIKILNMTFIKYLDFMRKNDLNKFKYEIINKEVKNGETREEAIKYVNELVELLFDYEGWFDRKTPRTPRKGKKAKEH